MQEVVLVPLELRLLAGLYRRIATPAGLVGEASAALGAVVSAHAKEGHRQQRTSANPSRRQRGRRRTNRRRLGSTGADVNERRQTAEAWDFRPCRSARRRA